MTSHRLGLGVELFEDRLLPSAYLFRDVTLLAPGPSAPGVVRDSGGGSAPGPGAHEAGVILLATAPDRGARPSDSSTGVGWRVIPVGGHGFPTADIPATPSNLAARGPAAPAPDSRLLEALGKGTGASPATWVADLLRSSPVLAPVGRSDLFSALPLAGLEEVITAGIRVREDAAGRIGLLFPAGLGQPPEKFAQPGEGGTVVGGDATVQAGGSPGAVMPTPATAAAFLQVIFVPPSALTSVWPWFAPATESGLTETTEAAGPIPSAQVEQSRSVDPTPYAEGFIPVETELPGGAPVAGLLRLDSARVEAGALHLMACVSDLAADLSEEIEAPGEMGWLTTAIVLTGGAGYALWVNRAARRPGRGLADPAGFGPRLLEEGHDHPPR